MLHFIYLFINKICYNYVNEGSTLRVWRRFGVCIVVENFRFFSNNYIIYKSSSSVPLFKLDHREKLAKLGSLSASANDQNVTCTDALTIQP